MKDLILEVKDLSVYYKTRNNENVYAVDGVSFELLPGKVLGIAGESGCGKSTLAQSLFGLYESPLYFHNGMIKMNGIDILKLSNEELRKTILGKKISYIPQAAMNALNPTLKVIHFILDLMAEHQPKTPKDEVLKLAKERFNALNLPERALYSYANELSGGMKQRVIIAISTMLNPDVLIADEPTSALDVSSQKVVMKLIRELLKRQYVKALIFITHELPLLYHIADDIIVMYAGEIVEKGTTKEVVFAPRHPYSKVLMESIMVPEVESKSHKMTAIPGVPPNLKVHIIGCRFADRCPLAGPECKRDKIELTTGDSGGSCRCIKAEGSVKK